MMPRVLRRKPSLFIVMSKNGDFDKSEGRTFWSNAFDRDAIGKRVLSRLEYCLEDLPAHRKRNFIGQMLQHQSMKATQYMSQWIEAKNHCDT